MSRGATKRVEPCPGAKDVSDAFRAAAPRPVCGRPDPAQEIVACSAAHRNDLTSRTKAVPPSCLDSAASRGTALRCETSTRHFVGHGRPATCANSNRRALRDRSGNRLQVAHASSTILFHPHVESGGRRDGAHVETSGGVGLFANIKILPHLLIGFGILVLRIAGLSAFMIRLGETTRRSASGSRRAADGEYDASQPSMGGVVVDTRMPHL